MGKQAPYTLAGVSAKQAAVDYTKARSKARKDEIRARIAERAESSKRARWSHLLHNIDAGELDKVKARATGDWKGVKRTPAKAESPAPVEAEHNTPSRPSVEDLVGQFEDADEALAAFTKAVETLLKARK